MTCWMTCGENFKNPSTKQRRRWHRYCGGTRRHHLLRPRLLCYCGTSTITTLLQDDECQEWLPVMSTFQQQVIVNIMIFYCNFFNKRNDIVNNLLVDQWKLKAHHGIQFIMIMDMWILVTVMIMILIALLQEEEMSLPSSMPFATSCTIDLPFTSLEHHGWWSKWPLNWR